MDRHRYVKTAYHGLRKLTDDERRAYHTRRLRAGTKRYHWVDSLYALSEVSVYAAAVDELERLGEFVDYAQLFDDIRASIDAAHQDGSILDHVVRDLPRFVRRDVTLGTALHRLRSDGSRRWRRTSRR